jgi:hypothetical protein
MKNCFVATLGSSKKFDNALKNLRRSLSVLDSLEFNVQTIPSLASSAELFSTTAIPHIVLVDPETLEGMEDEKRVHQFFTALRTLDAGVCIVILWNQAPSASELMTWLDRGATGLYNPNSEHAETNAALYEALEQRVSMQLPREPRALVKHSVRIQMASLEQAMAAETLNLGFGGMFLRISPRDIRTGDEVEFHLEFSDIIGKGSESSEATNPLLAKMDDPPKGSKAVTSLEGTGRVVWIRSSAKENLPEGIGLQFSKLTPAVRDRIRNFVVNHRLHAFIPKA